MSENTATSQGAEGTGTQGSDEQGSPNSEESPQTQSKDLVSMSFFELLMANLLEIGMKVKAKTSDGKGFEFIVDSAFLEIPTMEEDYYELYEYKLVTEE